MINPHDPPYYAADTLVSMPEPPKERPLVPMYGFAFTKYGLVHDITPGEAEELSIPRYSPYDPNKPLVRGDDRLDRTQSLWQDRG